MMRNSQSRDDVGVAAVCFILPPATCSTTQTSREGGTRGQPVRISSPLFRCQGAGLALLTERKMRSHTIAGDDGGINNDITAVGTL